MPTDSTATPATVEPALTVSAVARRLGVAPATLRTWDRRYGLGPSEHSAGAHRRYTPADVVRLEHMRRLLLAGATAGEAARSARALDVEGGDGAGLSNDAVAPARRGGGRVLATPGGAADVRGLARAAQALEYGGCVEIIQRSLKERGAIWTWDNLLLPVLSSVGQKWSTTGRSVEVEHVLSSATQQCLASYALDAAEPASPGVVILACAPNEQHSLPLVAIAAALAERGVASRLLSSGVPQEALNDAVRKLRPNVIFLWAQSPKTADPGLVEDLPRFRHPATIVIGGLGWGEVAHCLPGSVQTATDLTDAVARILHVVGG